MVASKEKKGCLSRSVGCGTILGACLLIGGCLAVMLSAPRHDQRELTGPGPATATTERTPAVSVSPVTEILAPIAGFLADHPEFGAPLGTMAIPDWARGRRQRVTVEGGRSLLFYLEGDQVVTVWEDQPGKGRVRVWGK